MENAPYGHASLLQLTNGTCVQTVAAMLMSHYDDKITLDEVVMSAPPVIDAEGEELGTSLQSLALYCVEQGFEVNLYSSDALFLDLKWRELPVERILERMEAVRETRIFNRFGLEMSEHYFGSYIDFLKKGGRLGIKPYFDLAFFDQLLAAGPFAAGVSYPTLLGTGHAKNTGLRESIPDDTSRGISSHAVLVYGSEGDNYLIADPWGNPAEYAVPKEQLQSAVMAAQWACDNVVFRIVGKN